MNDEEKFWVDDPCVLVRKLSILPTARMTTNERLNTLTRFVIVVTVVMYYAKYEYWLSFLLLSIISIIVIKCTTTKSDMNKENFTITPTYISPKFEQTVVAPLYSEEWQIPPPAYDLYTQSQDDTRFEEPIKPQSYPYGQYLTRTNLLPRDEYYTHLGCGGARSAREYVNGTYLRNDLAYRENISRIYKKKLDRRYRNECQDTFSPYQSY